MIAAWPRALMLAAALVAGAAAARVPVQQAEVVRTFPHDPGAFTEGLFYRQGELFESTGLEGRSDVRRVRLADGAVLERRALPPEIFGEGIVDWGGDLVSLTWKNGFGTRWSIAGLKPKARFTYAGEGWALTRSAREIWMSDGTPVLRVLDPVTLAVKRRVTVTADGVPVANLNELEYVKGAILANIWMTDRIARIDPATGKVTAWIDLSAIAAHHKRSIDDVANGIAYDARGDRLFVTGKLWTTLYQIRLSRPR